jgi:serine/threonine protein kinase
MEKNLGDLKAHPPVLNNPFARSLRNYKVLQEADVLTTAAIVQRCMRLNPKDRATAEELLQDPWWQGAASSEQFPLVTIAFVLSTI